MAERVQQLQALLIKLLVADRRTLAILDVETLVGYLPGQPSSAGRGSCVMISSSVHTVER